MFTLPLKASKNENETVKYTKEKGQNVHIFIRTLFFEKAIYPNHPGGHNCSAWLRLKLNTKIGLHTTDHTGTFLRTLGSVEGYGWYVD